MSTTPAQVAQMGAQYATELAKWTAAGFPRRNRVERNRVLAICLECKHFTKHPRISLQGRCDICLCPIGRWTQKLKWATTHCPDEPPRWKQLSAEQQEKRRTDRKMSPEEAKAFERHLKKRPCGGCKDKKKPKE